MSLADARRTTCCFTGHRPEKLPWGANEASPACVRLKRRLDEALQALYARGYRHFICGMAQGADLYFAEAVLALRARFPDVVLEAAIPCLSQADRWSAAERARYRDLVDRCDLESVVQERYDRCCMLRRNRYMVGHSSLLLAVYDGSAGGTRYTVGYAMDCGLEIIRLEPL